jgi:hypothetical protein
MNVHSTMLAYALLPATASTTLGRPLVRVGAAGCPCPVDRRRRTREFACQKKRPQPPKRGFRFSYRLNETVFHRPRSRPETDAGIASCPNNRRQAMTEIVTATLVLLSVAVFLAHALDAYRTG